MTRGVTGQKVGRVDVRRLALPPRAARVSQAFAALGPGQAMVLVSDRDPRSFLYQLQAEHPRRFDWAYLEAGPRVYRVEITRRVRPGPTGVADLLVWDHARLNAILQDVRTEAQARRFGTARRRFAEFGCGLAQHIRMEEEVLMPAFERITAAGSSPTASVRAAHASVERLVDALGAALAARATRRCATALERLAEELVAHQQHEESILYAISDRVAGDERDRENLMLRMRAV